MLWFALMGCVAADGTKAPPAPPAVEDCMGLRHAFEAPLPPRAVVEVPELCARVELVEDAHAMGLDADGRKIEWTEGKLRLTRDGQTEELGFRAGRPFERWGYTIKIRGDAGSLELGIYPPGAAVPK